MLAPVRIGDGGTLPVSLDEVKQHVGAVGFTSDDNELEGFIAAATGHLEKTLSIALTEQNWRQDLSCFPCRYYLAPGPVIEITSVSYRDADGAISTLPTDIYGLYADAFGSFVEFLSSDLPATAPRLDAVSISYRSCYAYGEFPPSLRAAILMHVGYLYGHRGQPDIPTIEDIPAYQMLIWPFRRPKV